MLFQDHLFFTSNQGLLECDLTGQEIHLYSALQGLPGNSLGPIVRTGDALWIGVSPQGLLKFNGIQFDYFFADQTTDFEITALLALPTGELLIGTKHRGLVVFQEDHVTEFASQTSAEFITSLLGDDHQITVGTLGGGVFLYRQGVFQQLGKGSTLEGRLLDNHITALAGNHQAVYVGTPLGINQIKDGKVTRSLASGFVIRSLFLGKRLLAGTDEGILSIDLELRNPGSAIALDNIKYVDSYKSSVQPALTGATLDGEGLEKAASAGPTSLAQLGASTVNGFFSFRNDLLAMTDAGLYLTDMIARIEWKRFGPTDLSTTAMLSSPRKESEKVRQASSPLSDTNVSALAIDRDQNLWVGFFDRGLDILNSQGQRISHYEDDRIFCINHILASQDGQVTVSTANGVAVFHGTQLGQFITDKEGLIHRSVAITQPIGPTSQHLLAATAEGVTLIKNNRPVQSLFAFHGLANNHVYSVNVLGNRTYLGTLGGISVMQDSQIVSSWTTANSALSVNWVNALVSMNGKLFIGTYGGGVQSVDSFGQWTDYSPVIGKFEVNPNAMAVDVDTLYVGTLDRGFFVHRPDQDTWLHVMDGLPSTSVTSFAFESSNLLVGTDNGIVRIQKDALH